MPFQPGQSGNPGGLKPGTPNILPEFKNKTLKQICKDLTKSVVLPELKKHAKKGNMQALELIIAYGHGKPIQQVNQLNVNMNYSSWTDAQVEEFSETGQMPMIQGDNEDDKPTKDTKLALNDKSKEVK